MPPKKGRCKGRGSAKGKGAYSSWNDGGWDDWSGYDDYYSYGSSGKGKGLWNRGTRPAWQKGSGKGESRDQFLTRLVWEDNSSRAWTEKQELADIVVCRVRTDLGLDEEGSSRSYDDGDMETAGEDHVPKSHNVEKRRLHKQKQRANVMAKLVSYEDLEARMEHMESLIQGHFDEEPNSLAISSLYYPIQPVSWLLPIISGQSSRGQKHKSNDSLLVHRLAPLSNI